MITDENKFWSYIIKDEKMSTSIVDLISKTAGIYYCMDRRSKVIPYSFIY